MIMLHHYDVNSGASSLTSAMASATKYILILFIHVTHEKDSRSFHSAFRYYNLSTVFPRCVGSRDSRLFVLRL